MKTLREVSEITGLSRRALQGYSEMNFINPTAKTVSNYWLYDDETIEKLLLVKVFVEIGYERNRIKEILNTLSEVDLAAELDCAIKKLYEKRRQIDEMIKLTRSYKSFTTLPEPTLRAFSKGFKTEKLADVRLGVAIDQFKAELESITEEDIKDGEEYLPFIYHFLAIGKLKESSFQNSLVQTCVDEFYRYIISLYSEDVEVSEADMYSKAYLDEFLELVLYLSSDDEWVEIIKPVCGDDSLDFIKEAVEFYIRIAPKYFCKA